MADPSGQTANVRPPDYERSDVSARAIALLAAGTALFLIATPYVLWWTYPSATRVDVARQAEPLPPPPRLQVDPAADLQAFRRDEERRLDTYAWVDRGHGVVRIPIMRAIELTAGRGLPGWPKP
jgi:hypothetical protein